MATSKNYTTPQPYCPEPPETLHPGDPFLKAVVLYDFKKPSRDEITVNDKEEVLIINNTNSRWWYIHKSTDGEAGYVPAT
ncbi:hypothetical protein AC579_5404 [Pseudocercospora musae]|uniref:SH3 domain-containing protein n=1 Tax=Pseudocercospora musae TaxID=113226 RepID=A0A139IDQ2_9PEZI|nr:hypothetical protein AC579_5404 [Pseudocercospora musae]